jgi:hypothetical protein
LKILAASIFLGAFAAAGAIACSSSDSTNKANPDGGTNPLGDGGLGGTLVSALPVDLTTHPYWTKSTNIAHYKVFQTRDEAITWFKSAQGRGDNGLASDTPVASSDPRYAAIDATVKDVWDGFVENFPDDTKDLPVPFVILINSQKAGAYALYDDALGASPNAFMIQTPSLAVGDIPLRGLIAHELTHHVLKHKWPGVEDKIEIWYDASKAAADGFGFQQANSPATHDTGKKAQLYGLATGDFSATQWNGVARPGSTIQSLVDALHQKAVATNAGPCGDADTASNALLTFADPLRDRATNTFNTTPDQLTQLGTLSSAYVTKETACTSVVTGTLFQFLATSNGTTEANIRSQASQPEIDANDKATSAYDATLKLTAGYDQYITSTDLKNVRYYSFEEQADDVAVNLLAVIAFDKTGITKFLQQAILDDAGRTECDKLVTSEPPYGIMSDPHHSTCWRIWHTSKLAASVGF